MATERPPRLWASLDATPPSNIDNHVFVYGEAVSLPHNATLTLNISDVPGQTDVERDQDLVRIEIVVQAVILLLAILGNGLVLLVLLCRKKSLGRMNLLIVHLALADLFVAFFNVLPQLVWDFTFRFQGGNVLCKAVKYFQLVAMYASSYVLVATAVDRYLVICHPLMTHSWTNKSVHLMALVGWAASLLLSFPQLAIFSYVETAPGSGVYDCWGTFKPDWTMQLYITWITATIYVLPLCFLVVAYGRICYVVWRSTASMQRTVKEVHVRFRKSRTFHETRTRQEYTEVSASGGEGSPPRNGTMRKCDRPPPTTNVQSHGRSMCKAKVKTFKLTLTVILCYLLCWAPFFVVQMWAVWDANAPFQGDAIVVIMLLASLNSCTNPWIYMAFTDNLCNYLTRCCRLASGRGGRLTRASTMDSEGRTRSSMFSRTQESIYRKDARIVVPLVALNSRGKAETRLA